MTYVVVWSHPESFCIALSGHRVLHNICIKPTFGCLPLSAEWGGGVSRQLQLKSDCQFLTADCWYLKTYSWFLKSYCWLLIARRSSADWRSEAGVLLSGAAAPASNQYQYRSMSQILSSDISQLCTFFFIDTIKVYGQIWAHEWALNDNNSWADVGHPCILLSA